MQDRHADLYLGSKRDDFGWCETTPHYLRCNFNYEALGTKAKKWLEVLWWLVRHIQPGVVGPGTKFGTKSKVAFKPASTLSSHVCQSPRIP